jgi:DNA-binding LacI/PurR family transcriptional regulator
MQKRTATILDVARSVGVGKSTVSLVLRGEGNISAATREAVLQAARNLNYDINPHAQGLRQRVSQQIDLFSLDLDVGVGTRKMQAIQHMLGIKGYAVPIHGYGYRLTGHPINQAELLRGVCRQRPRAIVCNNNGLLEEARDELERYLDGGGIAICYDEYVVPTADSVLFDREDNTYQAVRHLLELGHRKVGAFLRGHTQPACRRVAGFERALREWNVEQRSEWMFTTHDYIQFEEFGVELAQKFLGLKDRPTAMCILNDHTSLAFIAEVERAGVRVPQDLSVVSHDDAFIARCAPLPLTTVSHPVEEIAAAVVEMLESRLHGQCGDAPRQIVIKGELVTRSSAAPPGS